MIEKFRALFYSNIITSWFFAGSFVLIFFCVVFYGIDYITAQRDDIYHLYFQWELSVPLVPIMYISYYSVLLLPIVVPCLVSSPYRVKLWAEQMSLAITIGAILFLLFPATLGYPETSSPVLISREITRMITGTYNLMPSLHVALSLVTIHIVWLELKITGKVLMLLWAALMALSTILTHQHHILDVVSGLFVGWFVVVLFQWKNKEKDTL